ncbi:MAG TPA: peptide deformylase [Syntrophothermus lipocalidus]|nr:peptide deformylase [Syntrophothermus lipocalidus]
MAAYQIVVVPDPVLREKALPVTSFNQGLIRLLENMKDSLYEAEGVGLAAPQIGVLRRVVVFDAGDGLVELINPRILEEEGEEAGIEGCLSIHNTRGLVKRAKRVVVEALNRYGENIRIEGEGLVARVIQHEIDHLDGILFTDRAEWVEGNGRK